MSVRRATGTERRWVDAARGAFALVGVLLLAGGVPALLIAWVGWPLPAEMPTVDEVSTALSTADISDAFLIKTLALVVWLVWIELMTSLIVEAVAHARGREAGRVPFGGGMQRAAARLIATVALLGALTTAKGAPEAAKLALEPLASGLPTPTFVMADDSDQASLDESSGAFGGLGDSAGQEAEEAEAPQDLPVYEVKPRDTLWGISENHLQDPFRWPEIFELNKGQAQPDGKVLNDPDKIYPGWQLKLPADAVGVEPLAPQQDTSRDGGPDAGTGGGQAEPTSESGSDGGSGGGTGGGGGGAGGSGGGSGGYDQDSRGGSGGYPDGGGMTLLPEPEAATPEYAAPPGMVLLPDEIDPGSADDPESQRPGVPVPGLGQGGAEWAAPAAQPRRRPQAYQWTDDDDEG